MKFTRKTQTNFIGIDEVGRGSLAGPVTVAVVLLSHRSHSYFKSKKFLHPLRDSKRLSFRQRVWWHRFIRTRSRVFRGGAWYAVASVSPRGIERTNITRAANQAATRAMRLLSKKAATRVRRARVMLDGGLFLTRHAYRAYVSKSKGTKTPHGDLHFIEIQLASIMAKVSRDRVLKKLHTKYPRYNFDVNKGYGTRAHLRALKKHGASPVHRKTFVKHLL